MIDIKNDVVIYKIQNSSDGKVYVGSTTNLKNRWKCHRTALRRGIHHSKHLQFAWNLYGEECFSLMELERTNDVRRIEVEQYWIDSLAACKASHGYNHAPTAGSCLGKKHSEETKQKIRLANLGKKKSPEQCRRVSDGQKGRITSDETKKKISDALKGRILSKESYLKSAETRKQKGRVMSIEARQSIREKAIGRKVSESTRKKLSDAGKMRKWSDSQRDKFSKIERNPISEEHRLKISKGRGFEQFNVICPDSRIFIFESLSQARDALGLDPSNVQKCLAGKARQTKGYRCYRDPKTFG